jgi:hypothetical protein
MEALGWSNDDTEYHFQGPLKLVNRDTGEEFLVLDENFNIIPEEEWDPAAGLDKISLPLTEWFPSDVNPVREGRYIVSDNKIPHWPFPVYAEWDGQKWSDDSIAQWRGLAEDPNK